MRFADLVGNIFSLDKHIGKKTIIITVLTTFFLAFFKFILEQEAISRNFTIKEFVYPLLAISLVYISMNLNQITVFFKKYFVFNWILFSGIIFEILLLFTIVYVSKGDLYGWIIGIFWLFSGLLRVLIQFSKAIFSADIQDYLKIIQIFAYSRAAYFAIAIITFYPLLQIKLPLVWFIFVATIFLFAGWFIINLYPYMVKHQNVRNVILLMRTVKDEKRIKINQLKNLTDFSESYFNKILNRLVSANFLKIQNKRVELGEGYKYISRIN